MTKVTVRTTQQHVNSHGPQAIKAVGSTYEVSERDAARLIGAGVVEDPATARAATKRPPAKRKAAPKRKAVAKPAPAATGEGPA